ncbi:hypothetical protein [Clostridium sp. M14]|uniref:hypothetical protein n=1 Tax=Clostridium sp. M14 TaxID=2716311 RepID=UPI0029624C51|nr:hypothetical protein [Clostridium sp. M14]
MQVTGSDAESEYIIVDTNVEGAEGKYRARKIKVAIQVDSFDDNDGVNGSFLGMGDVVLGSFDRITRIFIEGFTPEEL